MRNLFILSIIIIAMSCKTESIKYPETKKVIVVDTFFGKTVADPYRWLEDDNSTETANWVIAQNKLTNSFLSKLPARESINKRLTELWDYPKSGAPFTISGRWFIFKNNGLQNQYVLYLLDSLKTNPRVLLDPNTLSEDGTVAYAGMDVSDDGKYLVYLISRSGSDWNEIFVKDIETGKLLNDHIEWVKFSGVSCFNNGFYYSAYDKPAKGGELSNLSNGQKVFYHQFGKLQSDDQLIYANSSNPKRMHGASLTDEKDFLFITESESTSGNGLYAKSTKNPKANLIKLADGFDNDYTPIESYNGKILVLTNDNAPTYRVIAIDPQKPSKENWQEVVPAKKSTLQSCTYCGNKLFLTYMEDAKSKIEIYSPDGKFEGTLSLPNNCSVVSFNGSKTGNDIFYSYSSYNNPGSVKHYTISTSESEVYFEPELKFNPDDFEVKQEFYKSTDGTTIPLFIFSKKGVKLDGTNPTLLYGYGGFNISLTPSFSPMNLFFVEKGGVYVVANIRGGGEYGESWHKAGTLLQKQNVFNDFISAAEFLIKEGYTSPSKLAIRGGSNGGLLVGAVVNQRPDLFRVALPAVGVMDMLRYQNFTIGYAWATDYGTAADSEEMFTNLISYSPYHTIKSGVEYPAILAFTADHDDRVVPAHTFKYMAQMQSLNTGKLPTFVRIDTKAGHGSGKPTAKIIEEYSDMFAFTFHFLEMK